MDSLSVNCSNASSRGTTLILTCARMLPAPCNYLVMAKRLLATILITHPGYLETSQFRRSTACLSWNCGHLLPICIARTSNIPWSMHTTAIIYRNAMFHESNGLIMMEVSSNKIEYIFIYLGDLLSSKVPLKQSWAAPKHWVDRRNRARLGKAE